MTNFSTSPSWETYVTSLMAPASILHLQSPALPATFKTQPNATCFYSNTYPDTSKALPPIASHTLNTTPHLHKPTQMLTLPDCPQDDARPARYTLPLVLRSPGHPKNISLRLAHAKRNMSQPALASKRHSGSVVSLQKPPSKPHQP